MGLSIAYSLKVQGKRVEAEAAMNRWRQKVEERHPDIRLQPVTGECFGFVLRHLAGAEQARFLLQLEDGVWVGSDSPKTQYASLPTHGGTPHFIKAHLQIIAVLDIGREMGVVVRVDDDGGYWEARDIKKLLECLRLNQAAVAQLFGMLKDAFGGDQVESPITEHPDFERMEAQESALQAVTAWEPSRDVEQAERGVRPSHGQRFKRAAS
jgi:hypothetical protein